MAATPEIEKTTETRVENNDAQPQIIPPDMEAVIDAEPVHLGWRTWLVVFASGFFA